MSAANRPDAYSINTPETPGQVRVWEEVKSQYLSLGLCHYCAAQAAYGHQQGFAVIEPPCADCLPVIRTFAFGAPKGWRKASREQLRGPRMSSPGCAGRTDPGEVS